MANLPRLYDCFTFFNELDVLELRLQELKDIAFRFVLVESTHTFTGQPKPLYYEENKQRFAAFHDRIVHIVVRDMPGAEVTAWERESHQRRAIMRGLADAQPQDAILISDVDEIPRSVVLEKTLGDDRWRSAITAFQSKMFVYALNLGAVNSGPLNQSWGQTPRLIERRYLSDPQILRRLRIRHKKNNWFTQLQERLEIWRKLGHFLPLKRISNGAWHFTYIGDAKAQLQKLSAFSHTELATTENLDPTAIADRLANRTVVFNKDIKLVLHPLDGTMPAYLLENRAKFQHLLAD